jgi:hypothetical protein
MAIDNIGFFGKNSSSFWTGIIVPFNSQKEQVSGFGWGWRYKVRIMGYYPNSDEVTDENTVYAISLLSASDGTGGGGRYRSARYSQGDVVFGIYMGANAEIPLIIGAFPRTSGIKYGGSGKFDPKSGFTNTLKPGLLKNQEANENDGPSTPQLKPQTNNNGTNQQRQTPKEQLQKQMGIDPKTENKVAAVTPPPTPIKNSVSASLYNRLNNSDPPMLQTGTTRTGSPTFTPPDGKLYNDKGYRWNGVGYYSAGQELQPADARTGGTKFDKPVTYDPAKAKIYNPAAELPTPTETGNLW